ncbi:hypothetical protein Nepgr_009652 [Nepenthes gracilis]|uniref:Uncharacterized protein n=1 Tax=Nepenthes gracilis TaxID=150966 RepID=A0AAD3XKC6_NEPGR|nr:hypothetical protein Nepgr_009652 [Nepenthes gracilis]
MNSRAMRTRRSATNCGSVCSSSSSSCFSSTNSTISSYSLASSSNSTSSSLINSANLNPNRCEGLDLLVKAVYYVAGSAVGVPYVQRRVITRRKKALRFSNLIVSELFKTAEEEKESEKEEKAKKQTEINENSEKKRQRRAMALPSKFQDSVLHPWSLRNRGRRSRASSSIMIQDL